MQFDIVICSGILHHLNDDECMELFELAHSSLKPQGRMITFDGCYIEEQSKLAKFFISLERGKYVRHPEHYIDLAKRKFSHVQVHIRNDLNRIPFTHIIMECMK